MGMKYPKGTKPRHNNPASRKKSRSGTVRYGSRGMTLEKDLDHTNQFYLETGRAVIHKKPTPVQIVNVDYPSRNRAKIDEAYFKVPSTSDYNGIYRGKYIDFEAKETHNESRFPFINIHEHQVDHMIRCHRHGGLVFIILRFSFYGETYMMPFEKFLPFWDAYKDGGRKSIRYQDIKYESILLKQAINPRIQYLDAVDEFYFENGE
ncbi:Holliday junction resolvase RecU [Salinicoccus siamensis]|uniref:Holliday junction resolvase RecU n=1 Tax=Salinicoccus siamensis TaxID=381830 RepID=A0ABV5Z166_9STAP